MYERATSMLTDKTGFSPPALHETDAYIPKDPLSLLALAVVALIRGRRRPSQS